MFYSKALKLLTFIINRGFYPKGLGEVLLLVHPITNYLKPIIINNFGDCPTIRGVAFISGPKHQANKYQVNKLHSKYTNSVFYFN